MRLPYGVIVFFIVFLFQTTVGSSMAVFGYSPNFLLCLVVVFSFLYQRYYGLILGIIFGLLLDFAVGQYVGISAVAFVLIYLLISKLKEIFNQERVLPELLMSVIGTLTYIVVYWCIYALMGSPYTALYVLKSVPVLLIYNSLFVLIFHFIFVRSIIKHRRDKKFQGNIDVIKDYKNL